MLSRGRWTRGISPAISSSLCVHTSSKDVSDVERAVAQATASLLARIAAMEQENHQLKSQLKDAMASIKTIDQSMINAVVAKEDNDVELPLLQTMDDPLEDDTSLDEKLEIVTEVKEPTIIAQKPLVENKKAIVAKSLKTAKPPSNKFFFRLMYGSKTMQLSPKLRDSLNQLDVFGRSWEIHEIPAVMNCLVLLDRVPDALAFAKKWTNSITILDHLMGQAARVKCPKLALGLLQLAVERQYDVSTTTYNKCMVACARGPSSYLATVEHLFSDMQEHGHHPNGMTFGALLVAAARLDHWHSAQPTIDMMDTLPYEERLEAYTQVIIRLGRLDHHEFCYRIFKHAMEESLPLGEDAIRSVISSCGKIARRDDAAKMLDYVSLDSIQSLKTFNALIAAYANLNPPKAFEVFQELQKRPGLDLDIYTVNSVLLACVRQRSFEEGLELYESRPVPFDLVTICTMLQLFGQAKKPELAASIFLKALESLPASRALFEEYFEALIECNEADTAIDAFWKYNSHPGFQPTLKILNCLLRACHECTDTGFDLKGKQIFDWFLKKHESIGSVAYNHMLTLLIKAQKIDQAHEWFDEMRLKGIVTYFSFQQLMLAYYDCGEFAKCIDIYNSFQGQRIEMLQQVKWKPYAFPRTGLAVLAQRAHFALGDWDQVIAMAPQLKGRKGQLHPWYTDRGCQELLQKAILATEQKDDWQSCVSLYSMMVSVGMNDNEAYQATVRAVAKAGEFEAALDVNGGEWYRNERTSKGWFTDNNP
ncbi:hypothetical protein THRCLA_04297 [Thraustotheca clavata]|uniref:Pentacotripeptide-repeat region of PRORP domain-containing protein n=1 Tax=Thraustotheca clavata TaxID=74557 RepID=A0A1V9ZZG8_9STRA|nr:hypothetical protein THRCLA_04297 [Thraustotheca clavata]